MPPWCIKLNLIASRASTPDADYMVTELAEHIGSGHCAIALRVSPYQERQPHHIAAAQASMTEPDILSRVHRERRRAVLVFG
jgi:hypothetical protein